MQGRMRGARCRRACTPACMCYPTLLPTPSLLHPRLILCPRRDAEQPGPVGAAPRGRGRARQQPQGGRHGGGRQPRACCLHVSDKQRQQQEEVRGCKRWGWGARSAHLSCRLHSPQPPAPSLRAAALSPPPPRLMPPRLPAPPPVPAHRSGGSLLSSGSVASGMPRSREVVLGQLDEAFTGLCKQVGGTCMHARNSQSSWPLPRRLRPSGGQAAAREARPLCERSAALHVAPPPPPLPQVGLQAYSQSEFSSACDNLQVRSGCAWGGVPVGGGSATSKCRPLSLHARLPADLLTSLCSHANPAAAVAAATWLTPLQDLGLIGLAHAREAMWRRVTLRVRRAAALLPCPACARAANPQTTTAS